MRTRPLTDKELEQVVQLRERGCSWLKIQKDAKIPRRTAQRAYERWVKNRSMEELKSVRMSVATDEFQKHVNDLIRLAEAFVDYLHVPSSPNITVLDSRHTLDNLWLQDMHLVTISHYGSDTEETDRTKDRYAQQHRILFDCLKQHTKGKMDWQPMREWMQAWDRCRKNMDKLRVSTREKLFGTTGKLSDLLERIVSDSGEKDAPDKLINGALEAVWQCILAGKSYQVEDFVRIGSYSRGKYTTLIMGSGEAQVRLSFSNKGLAEEVADIIRRVVSDLCLNNNARLGASDVKTMRDKIAELEKQLYPVVLRPIILNTQCDLCPVQ
jgi:hypothetical protein